MNNFESKLPISRHQAPIQKKKAPVQENIAYSKKHTHLTSSSIEDVDYNKAISYFKKNLHEKFNETMKKPSLADKINNLDKLESKIIKNLTTINKSNKNSIKTEIEVIEKKITLKEAELRTLTDGLSGSFRKLMTKNPEIVIDGLLKEITMLNQEKEYLNNTLNDYEKSLQSGNSILTEVKKTVDTLKKSPEAQAKQKSNLIEMVLYLNKTGHISVDELLSSLNDNESKTLDQLKMEILKIPVIQNISSISKNLTIEAAKEYIEDAPKKIQLNEVILYLHKNGHITTNELVSISDEKISSKEMKSRLLHVPLAKKIFSGDKEINIANVEKFQEKEKSNLVGFVLDLQKEGYITDKEALTVLTDEIKTLPQLKAEVLKIPFVKNFSEVSDNFTLQAAKHYVADAPKIANLLDIAVKLHESGLISKGELKSVYGEGSSNGTKAKLLNIPIAKEIFGNDKDLNFNKVAQFQKEEKSNLIALIMDLKLNNLIKQEDVAACLSDVDSKTASELKNDLLKISLIKDMTEANVEINLENAKKFVLHTITDHFLKHGYVTVSDLPRNFKELSTDKLKNELLNIPIVKKMCEGKKELSFDTVNAYVDKLTSDRDRYQHISMFLFLNEKGVIKSNDELVNLIDNNLTAKELQKLLWGIPVINKIINTGDVKLSKILIEQQIRINEGMVVDKSDKKLDSEKTKLNEFVQYLYRAGVIKESDCPSFFDAKLIHQKSLKELNAEIAKIPVLKGRDHNMVTARALVKEIRLNKANQVEEDEFVQNLIVNHLRPYWSGDIKAGAEDKLRAPITNALYKEFHTKFPDSKTSKAELEELALDKYVHLSTQQFNTNFKVITKRKPTSEDWVKYRSALVEAVVIDFKGMEYAKIKILERVQNALKSL